MLLPEELQRYSRQIQIPEIGEIGQEKLAQSQVLIIGAGGLGSPVAMYLAAAGVGTIGIADGDRVEVSNLQRQILHTQSRIGRKKAESAAETLSALNPHIHIETYPYFADDTNILQLIAHYDFVVDASDQLKNKFLINDACVLGQKPFVHGGITGFGGQVMTYVPNKGPCYRCIFGNLPEDPPPSPIPVIGMTAGIIGSIQAMEVVKFLLGMDSLLVGKLLVFDGLSMQFRTVAFPNRSAHCRVCGASADIYDLSWYAKV